jgi:3-hydroxyacyl-[acyl-carrier-protein] dehydratase
VKLPADTEAYMLHRSPMRLVRRLLRVDKDYAEAETVLDSTDVGVGPDDRVEAAVLVELVAQAYAAAKGYRDSIENKPPGPGYLVGGSDFRIEHIPSAGQALRITVRSSFAFEDFYLLEGQVLSQGRVLASGTLKVWVQPDAKTDGY